jgi:dephospho-CoA kinase
MAVPPRKAPGTYRGYVDRTSGRGGSRRRHTRRMRRVLLTGMSGVGKSTVAARLSRLGYEAVDTDHDGFSVVDEHGGKRWDLDRIRRLLATEDVDVLFVVGTDESQGRLYPYFDDIVLLSAPREVMVERIASRTNNPFGKSPDELAKIISDLETYEPMMRRTATHEIDTSKPLDDVIEEILRLVEQPPAP